MGAHRKLVPSAPIRAKSDADRRLFEAVGAFLFDHRLEPSPANYLLAFTLVTRADPAAAAAVAAVTGDGIRLSQRDADRIMADAGLTVGAPQPVCSGAALEEAGRQLDAIAAIAGATQAHAHRYGRDLADTASKLKEEAAPDPIGHLLRITATMAERTREAELELQSTADEVRSLRRELAAISQEARTDALTGLANRRALEDWFGELQKAGVSFHVAICDIDRFKAINDRHGHSVGDRVLKAVAAVLRGHSPGQLVARYGGEEFVLLLSGLRLAGAVNLIDAARCDLASRHFRVRETDEEIGSVTFSAGVVEADAGRSWVEVVSQADEMLYRAKNGGRNRVESAIASGAAQ